MEVGLEKGTQHPRDAKAALARELVARFHDEAAAAAAEEHFNQLFRAKRLSADAELVPCQLVPGDNEGGQVFLPKLLQRWFGLSRSEARRRIEQGGIAIADVQVTTELIPFDGLAGSTIKAGKSTRFHGVIRKTE